MDDEKKEIKITIEKVTKFNYFRHGIVFYAAVVSLYQDFLGKDAYIEACKNHWIDPSISVPIAIGMLVIIFIDIIRKVRSGA